MIGARLSGIDLFIGVGYSRDSEWHLLESSHRESSNCIPSLYWRIIMKWKRWIGIFPRNVKVSLTILLSCVEKCGKEED
ncbi:hypothetical protein Ocin01_13270 [Orchesella cincta]|uniref:Uncharacterized protein n=1 Tax=Orchesella cincta TaxID=48709 RepID=A0A1D2MKK3_ORCCI|nr:hypothetical protein Ocin01_13270 [Orchesella cincta]